MSRYFDKDFFKFTFGFALIILVSLGILLITKAYQSRQDDKPIDPLINIAQP